MIHGRLTGPGTNCHGVTSCTDAIRTVSILNSALNFLRFDMTYLHDHYRSLLMCLENQDLIQVDLFLLFANEAWFAQVSSCLHQKTVR